MEKDMHDKSIQDKSTETTNIRDHLANERTFLAWIRTSIGIMAFGFVVEKFSIFVKHITAFLTKAQISELPHTTPQGYTSTFGLFLVTLGTLICLLAFIRYKKIEKQIES